jgi:hypothetical protein
MFHPFDLVIKLFGRILSSYEMLLSVTIRFLPHVMPFVYILFKIFRIRIGNRTHSRNLAYFVPVIQHTFLASLREVNLKMDRRLGAGL